VNLLLFNLATDRTHVTLAFGLRWIEELARHFSHIDVVTMYEGPHELPSNVTVWSVGREKGFSEPRRVIEFYRILFTILSRKSIDVAFTHMIHSFAVLFWPIGKLLGVKNLLWYAHGAVPMGLRIAHVAADRVVSSTPEGFRIPSHKVTYIGQGVEVGAFAQDSIRRHDNGEFRILSVGRISPVKGLDALLDALEQWKEPSSRRWRLDLVGGPTSPLEENYFVQLRQRAQCLKNGGKICFHGRLEPVQIRQFLNNADVFVNLSRTGSLDKAIVEAMMSGCPVLSSNEAFCAIAKHEGFSECCVTPMPKDVAAKLRWVAALDEAGRAMLGKRMAEVAVRDHSLNGLISLLTTILRSMTNHKVAAA
jgi:glycosyltransferase involved in cell wall biosynthesis